jgi:MFS family permease
MERFIDTKNHAAAILTIFFIFSYSPCYNLGYNALTYSESSRYPSPNGKPAYACVLAYLVEIFPYIGRSRGISWFQFYGRGAGFFATYVNPIGLANITWRWLIVYCCWLVFEIVFIYFFFPETSGRTLEELSFCKSFHVVAWFVFMLIKFDTVFEGKEKADEVTNATVKQIYEATEEPKRETAVDVSHIEVVGNSKSPA